MLQPLDNLVELAFNIFTLLKTETCSEKGYKHYLAIIQICGD